MTLVVADASPLRYLILIGAVELLPRIYDRIVVPGTVVRELRLSHAPEAVRNWASNPPEWMQIRVASQVELADILDPGEAEAVALAQGLKADFVLLDEREARGIAIAKGLRVAGTVGILERAADAGLVNLADAFERLMAINFRIDKQVLVAATERQNEKPKRADLRWPRLLIRARFSHAHRSGGSRARRSGR